MRRKGIIFVITAPSGAGKTTLIKRILKSMDNIVFSISYTTRKRRKEERNHKDYHFVSLDVFKKILKKKGFLEWAMVFGHYYGTPKNEAEKIINKGKDLILDVDIQGAFQVKKKKPKAVFVFIVPPNYQILKKRLEERKTETKNRIKNRLEIAKKDMARYKEFDYLVVNDRLDDAFNRLKSIILAERAKMKRSIRTIHSVLKTFKN